MTAITQTTDPRMARLAALGAATVYEANGQRDAIDPAIKPLDPTSRIAGRAVTVALEPADNWFIHVALLEAGEGDILVVDAKGYTQAGPWGDVLTLAAQERGLAGLVIDGAVRDSQEIIASGFPVFTRGVCIRKTSKVQRGKVNVPVTIGGVAVEPGDILVGDADGLVRVAAADIDTALTSSEHRELKEEQMRSRIREGATTLDLLGLTRP
ncbi:4-carboxy-4-hydroxy-2-oxoadipate aldolase/oxaloacetate decarboxylase [Pseudarthrobacter enclensis]|uniref:4-carboxy-4-hydroxy-2-oxoadipate aldolase/oxaloacetate decarboxylase n=1 Tax=Pseudarthrobacter enclensis TaxID=993070 RepID=UPI003EE14B27